MPGSTARANRKAPRSVTANSRSQSAGAQSSSVDFAVKAALLTSTSMAPNRATASATEAATAASSVTEPALAAACPPACTIAATLRPAAAASMSVTSTAAPSAARRSAVARPMPSPPPVTIAVLP